MVVRRQGKECQMLSGISMPLNGLAQTPLSYPSQFHYRISRTAEEGEQKSWKGFRLAYPVARYVDDF